MSIVACLLGALGVLANPQSFREHKLGDVPPGSNILDVQSTPRGNAYAYVVETKGNHRLIAPGLTIRPNSQILLFFLSPDGKRIAYWVLEDAGILLCLDGKIVERYPRNGRWGPIWPPAMSADATTLAYREIKQGVDEPKHRLAVGGTKGEEYEALGIPRVSRDGKVVAYHAEVSTDEEDFSLVLVNGERRSKHEYVYQTVLTPDGKTVAYCGLDEEKPFLVIGDRRIALPAPLRTLSLSDNGASWAGKSIRRNSEGAPNGEYILHDGKAHRVFALVLRPVFSSDGKHIAYRARDVNRQWRLVVDGVPVEAPGISGDPVFSADDMTVGYGAKIGNEVWWKLHGVQ